MKPIDAAPGTGGLWRTDVLWPFLLQRGALVLLVGVVCQSMPTRDNWYAFWELPFLDPWVRWDSIYYILVAEFGYGDSPWGNPAPFFPFYSGSIGLLSWLMPLPLAALVISNLASLGFFSLLHRYFSSRMSREATRRAIWIALLFPTSFFLTAAYSESLFLLCVVGVFVAADEERFGWASIAVLCATACRPLGGIVTTVPFAIAWLARSRKVGAIPWFVMGAAPGAMVVFGVHWLSSGEIFGFMLSGKALPLGGVTKGSTAPFWDILLDEGYSANLVRRVHNWSALAFAGTGALVLLYRRQIEAATYVALCVGVPMLFHGSVFNSASMLRYAMAGFPLFGVLATVRLNRETADGFWALAAMLQVALAVGFGSWVWAE